MRDQSKTGSGFDVAKIVEIARSGEVIVEGGKCEWLISSNLPGHCLNAASYVDATGKYLCTEHAEHLNRRFGLEITLISSEEGLT